jgi:DNA repair protein RecO (recombination protein O)
VIQPNVNYFDVGQGGVLCPRCGEGLSVDKKALIRPVSVNALKVLRYLQTHSYKQCSRLRLKPDTHRDLEALMMHYITYILERNLKSVAFLNRVRDKEGI